MNDRIGRARISLRIACCTLLLAALTYACGGGSDTPTQPPGTTGPIRVIAGGGQTDTIGAVLQQALVVEIHDSTGRIATGRTVRFTSTIGSGQPGLFVSPLDQQNFNTFASDVSDGQGRAKCLVMMWYVAGTARLEIAVPELGVVDTVTYTVKPGSPARFTISPRDTSVAPGGSYTLKVAMTDRYSNPVAAVVPTFSATGVSVSSAGQVTAGSATARAKIVVSYQALSDSANVSVVPHLPMVITRGSGAGSALVLINSDGSGATTLITSSDNSLAPSSVSTTPSVVYYQGDPGSNGKVWIVQPTGASRALMPGVTRPEGWPRLSPDGVWVYFVRDYKSLWRARLDGSGLDSLTSFTASRVYAAPTISPDGRSVAIEDGTGLQVIDVATKASTRLSVPCAFPQYSPDGAFFACATLSDVSIMRTDGTGSRMVANLMTSGALDELSGVDWTPDGKWLLVMIGYRYAALVEVSSGAVLPLTGLGAAYFQPSFVR